MRRIHCIVCVAALLVGWAAMAAPPGDSLTPSEIINLRPYGYRDAWDSLGSRISFLSESTVVIVLRHETINPDWRKHSLSDGRVVRTPLSAMMLQDPIPVLVADLDTKKVSSAQGPDQMLLGFQVLGNGWLMLYTLPAPGKQEATPFFYDSQAGTLRQASLSELRSSGSTLAISRAGPVGAPKGQGAPDAVSSGYEAFAAGSDQGRQIADALDGARLLTEARKSQNSSGTNVLWLDRPDKPEQKVYASKDGSCMITAKFINSDRISVQTCGEHAVYSATGVRLYKLRNDGNLLTCAGGQTFAVVEKKNTFSDTLAHGLDIDNRVSNLQIIHVFQAEDGKKLFEIRSDPRQGSAVSLSPSGKQIAMLRQGNVEIYRVP